MVLLVRVVQEEVELVDLLVEWGLTELLIPEEEVVAVLVMHQVSHPAAQAVQA